MSLHTASASIAALYCLGDDPVAEAIFFQQRRREAVIPEPAAALPIDCLCDATLVFAVDDLLEARDDMGMAMLAQLHHDPAPAHLVGNRPGRARTGEGIEDEIAWVRRNFENSLQAVFLA